MKPIRIVLLCATNRGIAFVRRIFSLCPEAHFVVCSFPETPWEPPYLGALEGIVKAAGHRLIISRHVAAGDLFSDGDFDLMFAVSWRYLVPKEVYSRASQGAFVFHDSLLPKYRGFSPTVWAMINGESETGVTLFEMAEPVDSGRIVDQMAISIGAEEYIGSVIERVTNVYLELLQRNLRHLLDGTFVLHEQIHSDATFTCKRRPDDNRIRWEASAGEIFNLIRACSVPYPGAYCFLNGKRLTIWKSDPPDRAHPYIGAIPGRIVERIPGQGVRVLANDCSLLIRDVQVEGGPLMSADQLLPTSSESLT